MQRDNHHARKFPFGQEGPPNKKERPTIELKRDPSDVVGYIPPISTSFLAQLRARGINRINPLMVAMLLYREQMLQEAQAKKRCKKPAEYFRTSTQIRRDLGISPEAHSNALNKLEAAGIIELARTADNGRLVARFLITPTPPKGSIHVNTATNERTQHKY